MSVARLGSWVRWGYQRWKSAESWSLRTRVRIWSSRCASRGLHRICCFLTMRFFRTSEAGGRARAARDLCVEPVSGAGLVTVEGQ